VWDNEGNSDNNKALIRNEIRAIDCEVVMYKSVVDLMEMKRKSRSRYPKLL
jgi:hypothetical protein